MEKDGYGEEGESGENSPFDRVLKIEAENNNMDKETSTDPHDNRKDNNDMNKKKDEYPAEANISVKKRGTGRDIRNAMFSTFIRSYGMIPINFAVSYMISRILTEDLWGIFIYVTVFVSGANIFLEFIPPSINQVLLYKLPELLIKKRYSEVKGIFGYALRTRTYYALFLMAVYIGISFLIFPGEEGVLRRWGVIITSPLIIMDAVANVMVYLLWALKEFNLTAYVPFLQRSVFLGVLIILFLSGTGGVPAYFIIVIGNVTGMLLFLPVYLPNYLRRFGKIKAAPVNWDTIKSTVKFGIYFTIQSSSYNIYRQVVYTAIDRGLGADKLTHYNITMSAVSQPVRAFTFPIGPILADYEKKGQREKMNLLLMDVFKFNTLILAFLAGAMYYFSAIYIIVIYPPEYTVVIDLIKIFVFIIYFQPLMVNFIAIYGVIDRPRTMCWIYLLYAAALSVNGLLAPISGLEVLLFFTLLIEAGTTVIYWLIGYVKENIKVNPKYIYGNFLVLIIIKILTDYAGVLIRSFGIQNTVAEIVSGWLSGIINIAESTVYSLIDAGIMLIIFIVFFGIYLIFLGGIRKSDLDKLASAGIKVPFRSIFTKILRK